jgi:hypothetical protein
VDTRLVFFTMAALLSKIRGSFGIADPSKVHLCAVGYPAG